MIVLEVYREDRVEADLYDEPGGATRIGLLAFSGLAGATRWAENFGQVPRAAWERVEDRKVWVARGAGVANGQPIRCVATEVEVDGAADIRSRSD